ncbi:MAG: phosphoribosylformylglycinamidine cyclo-ligase, partial [Dehalococcoidia bacterium]
MPDSSNRATYSSSGVDTDAAQLGLSGLLSWVSKTRDFRRGMGEQMLSIGFFASVLRLTDNLSLAVSTDGVGSKSVLAQMLDRYESIGWDCVAVNVNDVICTGAEPFALVDYISLQYPHQSLLTELGKGMHDGAERARVAIVGGELSQHPDTLTGPREGYAFDISGTCVGILDGKTPITGSAIQPGDVVLGMASNGIHANGLTLARSVLLPEGAGSAERYLQDCGMTVGEELLRPTHIYVPEAAALLASGADVRGMAHISGDGLLNLTRLDADVSYSIDA